MYAYCWRDYVELFFVVATVLWITTWLNRDKTRHLVLYFYFYCFLIFATYALSLPVAHKLLVAAVPLVIMIFVLMHEEVLQKRFAVPVRAVPHGPVDDTWIDELLQACLFAMNTNTALTFLLEHHDTIGSLITKGCTFETPLTKNKILVLVESRLFDRSSMIWIRSDGILVGINASWIQESESSAGNDAKQRAWLMALLASHKTDVLVLRTNPEHNSFDIALRGNSAQNLTSAHCRMLLRQYVCAARPPTSVTLTKSSYGEKSGAPPP